MLGFVLVIASSAYVGPIVLPLDAVNVIVVTATAARTVLLLHRDAMTVTKFVGTLTLFSSYLLLLVVIGSDLSVHVLGPLVVVLMGSVLMDHGRRRPSPLVTLAHAALFLWNIHSSVAAFPTMTHRFSVVGFSLLTLCITKYDYEIRPKAASDNALTHEASKDM
ncbi:Aste57867_21982 [Aphanomyces stellatus]|uniref:Aste57867_21982 protein n=1 Tax=Aphanomyces stellatus TaxID=120398 RepID=A0A485LJ15_9STRA|nr:hypothetical protein As57867_021913 [Aphanomyces stellatus]VFT98650.1 Aste57867_21982 [Aphanomyces stellatus]